MSAVWPLPRLYPIIDAAHFAADSNPIKALAVFAEELFAGGATLIQYRNKQCNAREMLRDGRELRRIADARVRLIMNDRVDLCLASGFNGVHLGQDDLSPVAARRIFAAVVSGEKEGHPLSIGFSTHSVDQVRQAETFPVDYVAIGPVFATASKRNPDPAIGLEGLRAARRATLKPLVAIGGITRQNCSQAIDAGADCVAIIADLVQSPRKSTEEFLRILG